MTWPLLRTALARPGPVAAGDVMVVAAHPDDETIGIGAQLARLRGVRLLHVTDGAPEDPADPEDPRRAAYAARRAAETARLLVVLGIPPGRHATLGITDQQATLHMAEVAERLAGLFHGSGIRTVITHAYEGGHPDHDATSLAAQAASALLRGRGRPAPLLLEMALYHGEPGGGPGGGLVANRFLTAAPDELVLPLDGAAQAAKAALYACHASQVRVLAQFPPGEERLRPAPAYDFRDPPHAGPLHYERHPGTAGGLTGPGWRVRAAMAWNALGLEPPPWR